MRKSATFCTVVVLMFLATSMSHALPSDNFNDNSIDTSLWNFYQDSPTILWLDETNQRLELRSTGVHNEAYADYYANAWGLSTTNDFSFKVDFQHSRISPAISGDQDWDFSIHLGLTKDWDNNVFLEAGYGVNPHNVIESHSFFYSATEINGFEVEKGEKDKTTDFGTLYMSYDANKDELNLSDTGYWATDAWVTITGLLQGKWGGDTVFPYIGGWSDGVVLNSGDAYLDNFIVDSGSVMVIPAPGSIALGAIAVGLVGWLRRRRTL